MKRKNEPIAEETANSPSKVTKPNKKEKQLTKPNKKEKQHAKQNKKESQNVKPKNGVKKEKSGKEPTKGKKEKTKKEPKNTKNGIENSEPVVEGEENGEDSSKKDLKNKGKKGNDPTTKRIFESSANWNEFKKKKKLEQVKRKQSRSLYEIITQAKQISEKMRVKKIPIAERRVLIDDLQKLLGNGNYVKLVLAHDMARVIQYMLKFGTIKVRQDISNEIIPATVVMLQSKYGKFCVKRMLLYGDSTIRANCIKTMYGHAVKLASHSISSPVFEFAYSTYASNADKINLIQEFFGDIYKKSKDSNVKHLRDVYTNSPEMKAAALGATKANLTRILDKNLFDSGLVQSVLIQFLSECSIDDRNELIPQLAPHIVVLGNSRDGARVGMQCIWNGTNKDRKVAMKALKEHVVELCKHEHGHAVIIALLDSADDVVLLQKTVLKEILAKIQDLLTDDWGRKVLLWLVSPGDKTHFHPQFITELETGRLSSSCKKDVEVRRNEILTHSISSLLNSISEAPKEWIQDASKAVVTFAVLKSGVGEELQNAFKSISEAIIDTDWKVLHENKEFLSIEHPGVHMVLKKIAKNDKSLVEKEITTFGTNLVQLLNRDIIDVWINVNRGCFLLADIYENNDENVRQQLTTLLGDCLNKIKKSKFAGGKILYKKIKGNS